MPDISTDEANAEIEKIIQLYLKVRDSKRAAVAKHEKEMAKFDEALGAAEQRMLTLLPKTASSMRTKFGTIVVSTRRLAEVADWPAFYGYIQKTGRFDMLQKRVAGGVVNEFIEDEDNEKHLPPPGVMMRSERKVSVRTPSKGAKNAAFDD